MNKSQIRLIFLFVFLFLMTVSASAGGNKENTGESTWASAGEQINNSFFFVVDKVVDLQGHFIWYAKGVGRVVFLIAIFSAALNHFLTGTGLKENLIKIFKATVFFLVIISVYPRIISWISTETFNMAYDSVGSSVEDYFKNATTEIIENKQTVSGTSTNTYLGANVRLETSTTVTKILLDNQNLFSDITVKRKHPRIGEYTAVAPANVLKILFLMAGDFIKFADNKDDFNIFPEFSRILKGLICAGFTIATGCIALLEYIVCFLEFMLVASVGVILFPLSIWEGSKFMSEKFIGALVGFFMKMLFCNIAIFLLLYGFISVYYTYTNSGGFQGAVDQIIFIVFSCLLFFYICKSAPGIAQSLLTGTPTLSASGAISAAAGAVGGAMAATRLAGKVGGKVGGTVVGGAAKGILGFAGSMHEANAAKASAMQQVAEAGGSEKQISSAGNRAFASSVMGDVGDSFKSAGLGLTRRLLDGGGSSSGRSGGGVNPHSWLQDFKNRPNEKGGHQTFGEHFANRAEEGRTRGNKSAEKYISKNYNLSANRERQKDPDYSSSLDELNKEFPGPSNNDIK